MSFELEFYEDENGDEPVLRWLREDLTPMQRRAIGVALREIDVARKRLADFRRRSGE